MTPNVKAEEIATVEIQDLELTEPETESIAGGRITNIRANANGITGGGPIPANTVAP